MDETIRINFNNSEQTVNLNEELINVSIDSPQNIYSLYSSSYIVSTSYADTASYFNGSVVSSSYALSASYAPSLGSSGLWTSSIDGAISRQSDVKITGSLKVSGSICVPQTSSVIVGDTRITSYLDPQYGSYYGNVTIQANEGNKDTVLKISPTGSAENSVIELVNNYNTPTVYEGLQMKMWADRFEFRTRATAGRTLRPILFGADGYPNNIPTLTIGTSSYVGIGTLNPKQKLDVSGSTKFGINSASIHQFTGSLSISGSDLYFSDKTLVIKNNSDSTSSVTDIIKFQYGFVGGSTFNDYLKLDSAGQLSTNLNNIRFGTSGGVKTAVISSGYQIADSSFYLWSSDGNPAGTSDTGLKRNSAGTILVTKGLSNTGSLILNDLTASNIRINDSLNVSTGITGSLLGTSSIAINSYTASYYNGSVVSSSYSTYAVTASLLLGSVVSSSYSLTSSYAATSVWNNISNKPALLSGSAQISNEISGSFTSLSSSISSRIFTSETNINNLQTKSVYSGSFTGSLLGTSSIALTASYFSGTVLSSSYSVSSSNSNYAQTASYLLGSISSASYSNYSATASLLLGSVVSSSYALTASYALNGGGVGTGYWTSSVDGSISRQSDVKITGSLAITGSIDLTGSMNVTIDNLQVSGNVVITGSLILGGGLTGSNYSTASMTSDVTIANTNQWYNAVSCSVTPGIWLATGEISLQRMSTTAQWYFARITDGVSSLSSGQQYVPSAASASCTIPLSCVVVATGSYFLYLQGGSATSTNNLIKAKTFAPAANLNNQDRATILSVVKIN